MPALFYWEIRAYWRTAPRLPNEAAIEEMALFRAWSAIRVRNCAPLDHPFAFDLTSHLHSF